MDPVSFGLRLRELRVAAGLSQTQLAARSAIPQNTLSNWERGTREVSALFLPTLADALGVSIDALFSEAVAELPPPRRGRPRKPK